MHDFPSISWELASKLALIHNRIFNLLICSNQNTLKKINVVLKIIRFFFKLQNDNTKCNIKIFTDELFHCFPLRSASVI